MRSLLVEERGFHESELASMRNLMAALSRLQNSRRPEDILAREFGTIDAAVQSRMAAADSEQLLAWAERILTSDNIDEVFG